MKKNKKKFDPLKAAAASRRKAYFANGGDLSTWRGRATVFSDKKKAASKKACRKKVFEGQ